MAGFECPLNTPSTHILNSVYDYYCIGNTHARDLDAFLGRFGACLKVCLKMNNS